MFATVMWTGRASVPSIIEEHCDSATTTRLMHLQPRPGSSHQLRSNRQRRRARQNGCQLGHSSWDRGRRAGGCRRCGCGYRCSAHQGFCVTSYLVAFSPMNGMFLYAQSSGCIFLSKMHEPVYTTASVAMRSSSRMSYTCAGVTQPCFAAVCAVPRARRRVYSWWPSTASGEKDSGKAVTARDRTIIKVHRRLHWFVTPAPHIRRRV